MVQLILWLALVVSQLFFLVASVMGNGGDFKMLTSFSSAEVWSSMQASPAIAVVPLAVIVFLGAMIGGALFTKKIKVRLEAEGLDPTSTVYQQRLFVPSVLKLALLESVTLYGFVLAMAVHQPAAMLPFLLLALIGFAFSVPSRTPPQV